MVDRLYPRGEEEYSVYVLHRGSRLLMMMTLLQQVSETNYSSDY